MGVWGRVGKGVPLEIGGILPTPVLDYAMEKLGYKASNQQLPVCGWIKGFSLVHRTSLRALGNKRFGGRVTLRCLIHTEGWEGPGSTRQ